MAKKIIIHSSTLENAEKALDAIKVEKTIEIIGAKLKDEFCNYTYELVSGPTMGDSCNRAGASIVHHDMKVGFKKLNVHLALVCEEILNTEIDDIDLLADYNDDNHTKSSIEYKVSRFKVSQFKIDGAGDNESVQLIGTKTLSTGEDVELKTPRVKWDGSYLFVNELRALIDDLKLEVEKYMNGKTAPKLVQSEIDFDQNEDD